MDKSTITMAIFTSYVGYDGLPEGSHGNPWVSLGNDQKSWWVLMDFHDFPL